MHPALVVISLITIIVLLYLLAVNCKLGYERKNGSGARYRCLIYLRLLHVSSLIETLLELFNTYGGVTAARGCKFVTILIETAKASQLLWMILAWGMQVRAMAQILHGPGHGIFSHIFWSELTKLVVFLPIVCLLLTLCTLDSKWDPSADLKCSFSNYRWVLYSEATLITTVHMIFLFQFLIQIWQASKIVNDLMAKLTRMSLHDERSSQVINRMRSDATDCKLKAWSASRRNLIIGVNATFWNLWIYLLISPRGKVKTNDYLRRIATVLASLTINSSFYLIFSEWKFYICIFYHQCWWPKLGAEASRSLLHVEGLDGKGPQFVKRIATDKEVEYFASPAVIYQEMINRK